MCCRSSSNAFHVSGRCACFAQTAMSNRPSAAGTCMVRGRITQSGRHQPHLARSPPPDFQGDRGIVNLRSGGSGTAAAKLENTRAIRMDVSYLPQNGLLSPFPRPPQPPSTLPLQPLFLSPGHASSIASNFRKNRLRKIFIVVLAIRLDISRAALPSPESIWIIPLRASDQQGPFPPPHTSPCVNPASSSPSRLSPSPWRRTSPSTPLMSISPPEVGLLRRSRMRFILAARKANH